MQLFILLFIEGGSYVQVGTSALDLEDFYVDTPNRRTRTRGSFSSCEQSFAYSVNHPNSLPVGSSVDDDEARRYTPIISSAMRLHTHSGVSQIKCG